MIPISYIQGWSAEAPWPDSSQVEQDLIICRKLRVTGPERTLIDGFRRPDLVGGLPELVESAAGFPVMDLPLLFDLLEAHAQDAPSPRQGQCGGVLAQPWNLIVSTGFP